MTMKTLAVATILAAFAAGTVDTPFTFTITGTNTDGTPYSNSVLSDTPSVKVDLPAGTGFTVVVRKLDHTSLPSPPFDIQVPATVQFSVSDPSQAPSVG